ncbi:MAG: hypothetical protein ABI150_12840 [Nitrobacter sp.]
MPNLEITSDRWSDVVVGTQAANAPTLVAFPDSYIRTGTYTLANINLSYKIIENFEVVAASRACLTRTTSWRGDCRSRDAHSM